MRSVVALLGGACLMGGLSVGCGPAIFYDDVPDTQGSNDGWGESLKSMIHVPPERTSDTKACVEDLAGVKAQVSQAIEVTIARRDWRRQACLSQKAQTVGTLYNAAVNSTFRDQDGRLIELHGSCYASAIAREARACAGS